MAKVTIYVPDEAPVKYALDDEVEVTVGRSAENDIVIEHDSISGEHAKFARHGEQYHLVDLESTNGTFADGMEAASTPLHNGMRLVFGKVEADFECEEEFEREGGEGGEGGEGADGVEAGSAGEGHEDSFSSSIHAEIADQSVRPAGLKNLSPIEVIEKKDTVGQVAVLIGVVALLAALALGAVAFVMMG